MSDYEIRELEIDQILLDLQNPRYEIQKNQRESLAKIIAGQGKKLLNLAQDIVEDGINPSDLLIVIPTQNNSDRYFALEGNRRIAVLKLLLQPTLASSLNLSGSYLKKLDSLRLKFQEQPIESLLCAIFSERETANKWIVLKHTGENQGVGIVNWDASAIARFKMGVGNTARSTAWVKAVEFVQGNSKLDEETQEKIGSIAITNLGRLLDDPKVRDFLGISLEEGEIVTKLPAEEALKGLTKIVTDLANKKINVNDIRYKKDREDYLETFTDEEIPDHSKIGESTEPLRVIAQKPPKSTSGQKRSNPVSTKRKTLIPSSCVLKINNSRINNVYRELKSIEVEKFPNAVSITFRVFLEISIDEYITTNSITIQGRQTLAKKIEAAATHMESSGLMTRNQLKPVRTSVSNQNSIFSINTFNAFVHGGHYSPIPSELKLTWDNYQLFIEKIWE